MSIYDKSGNNLVAAYKVSGENLVKAYDIDSNNVFGGSFPLKVMQYNVGQWYIGAHDNVPADKDEQYYELQSGIIKRNNPDVLILEEYTAQFSKAGRTTISMLQSDYPYYHEQTNGTTTTVAQRAIFSKFPISNYATHPFNDGSSYYYDTCLMNVRGVQIALGVTHLHWNDISKRAAEIQKIISGMSQYERFILGGDFNTVDCFDTSGADYQQVVQPLLNQGWHIANCGEFGFMRSYYWSGTTNSTCLDNVVTSSNIEIMDAYVDTTKLTDSIADEIDHLPLIAELSISGA